MATTTITPTPDSWPDEQARIAELKRLAANLRLSEPIDSEYQARSFEDEMMTPAFWQSLFGVDSMPSAAELLAKCNANWHPVSSQPQTYTDQFSARSSLPVLARTVSGHLQIASVYWCEHADCTYCPVWSKAGISSRLPQDGPGSLTGWIGLDDILPLRKHPYWQMNQPTNVISIDGHQFNQNELNVLQQMRHKLTHGTEHEKRVIRELIAAFQRTINGS